MRFSSSDRQGLRVTVRFHDTVVAQDVHWQPRRGGGGVFPVAVSVPTPSGRLLAAARWTEFGTVDLRAKEPTASTATMAQGDSWRWENHSGVAVDIDFVPWKPAQRFSHHAWGDVALLVLMLTLMVGVAQMNYLLRQFMGAVPASERALEPTPELIARLLQRDFDGADRGQELRADRPDAPRSAPSFYLPAGSEGNWDRAGGGAHMGEQVRRGDSDPLADADNFDEISPNEAEDEFEVKQPPTLEAPDDSGSVAEVEIVLEEMERRPSLATPIERFIGWGFRDWFDVADARRDQEERIARILERTRIRLKIDPNDPYAIQTAAYYAYLSDNQELSAALHSRFIELYPAESSGYNNLALNYKRSGEFEREELLYRKALELDPLDTYAMNNLAVNLAHQKRFREALQLMDTIAELVPDDAYADLHRSKIFAAMGKRKKSILYLKKALAGVEQLDSLHHIEFRQDIRVDPAFQAIRKQPRFRRALEDAYGDGAAALLDTARDVHLSVHGVADG